MAQLKSQHPWERTSSKKAFEHLPKRGSRSPSQKNTRTKTAKVELSQNWEILDAVAFHHVSRPILWEAECALQRLRDIHEDPDTRNVFLKQIESCEEALRQKARFIASTEPPIVFIGSPGVGKTTAICSLADLRHPSEEDLNRQMALQAGAGRTTICEVHVKCSGEFALSIEPCSDEELWYHVADFCDHVLEKAEIANGTKTTDGGISIEIARAIRRMSQLVEKKAKGEDSKTRREDPAVALAHEYPDRDELQIQVLQRLNLPRRQRTSVSYPRDSAKPGLRWLSTIFGDINFGAHSEFSLPRRIEVSVPNPVPNPVLNSTAIEPRLIDTHDYWRKCQDRWGGGSGYKIDILKWTGDWFSDEARKERHEFIEAELQRLWRESLDQLAGKLRSVDPETAVSK